MALSINRVISDAASTACFEIVNDTGGESATIITPADLSGADASLDQSVFIKRVVATVANVDPTEATFVTLAWGDGTEFLHLPLGHTDINIGFGIGNVGADANVTVEASDGALFTLRIFVTKNKGFPASMGHSMSRP